MSEENKLPESGPYQVASQVASYSYETLRAAVDWRDKRITELEARAGELVGVVKRELALFDRVPTGSGIALSADAVAEFVSDCRAALTASPTATAARTRAADARAAQLAGALEELIESSPLDPDPSEAGKHSTLWATPGGALWQAIRAARAALTASPTATAAADVLRAADDLRTLIGYIRLSEFRDDVVVALATLTGRVDALRAAREVPASASGIAPVTNAGVVIIPAGGKE